MNQIHVTALLALSALALLTSTAFAQAPVLFPGTAGTSIPGAVNEDRVPICQTSGGGTRARRSNCEVETTTVRTEQELKVSIEVPAQPSAPQCEATTLTEYMQRSTIARVASRISVANCPATTGIFTIVLRVRDESGEIKPIEFSEMWQRDDAQDVSFNADYPIGENVELVSARVRDLRCTCTELPSEN